MPFTVAIIRSSLSVTLLTAINCLVFWVTFDGGHPFRLCWSPGTHLHVFRIHQIFLFRIPSSLTNEYGALSVSFSAETIPTTSSSSPSKGVPLSPLAAVRPIGRTFSSGSGWPCLTSLYIMISAMAVREFYFQQFIAFIDGDGCYTVRPGALIGSGGFL